jgi:putative hydrolase of the HAD superfamily
VTARSAAGAPARRAPEHAVNAVLLDMLGTLVELRDPVPRLRAELERRTGVDVGDEAAARGFGAEIAYYLEHHTEGRDRESLEDLRDRCAARMEAALGVDGLARGDVRVAMLASLEFAPFPDVEPALSALKERGLKLVVASNWDWSLPQWIERVGLGHLLDGSASSAVAGAAKPAPEVFRAALRLADVPAEQAVHVGDSLEGDVEGARAAGLRGILLRRVDDPPPDVESVRSLAELPRLL